MLLTDFIWIFLGFYQPNMDNSQSVTVCISQHDSLPKARATLRPMHNDILRRRYPGHGRHYSHINEAAQQKETKAGVIMSEETMTFLLTPPSFGWIERSSAQISKTPQACCTDAQWYHFKKQPTQLRTGRSR